MKFSSTEIEAIRSTPTAEVIARQGDYETILMRLKEHNHLTELVTKAKEEFGERISEPWLTEADWEMLAVLGAFDRTTLLHSIGVYEIAARKVRENLIGPDGTVRNIEQLIAAEGVSMPVFLHACLFHDIGKIEVPYEVLMNQLTESEWEACLERALDSTDRNSILRKLNLNPEETHTTETVTVTLNEQWLRPISVVPARIAITEAELAALIERGYTGEETLAEIIASHETYSAHILSAQGYHIEAELAGHHHNLHREKLRYPQSTEALRISAVTLGENAIGLLHAADVEEALTSAHRSYKQSLSLLHSLDILVDHARHHQLDTHLAYSWIRSELHGTSDTTTETVGLIDSFSGSSEDDPEALQELTYLNDINAFLAEVEHELLANRT